MVLPCALTIGTYGVISLRDDEKIRIYSENFKDTGIVHLHIGSKDLENGYYDYIIAMLALLEEKTSDQLVEGTNDGEEREERENSDPKEERI